MNLVHTASGMGQVAGCYVEDREYLGFVKCGIISGRAKQNYFYLTTGCAP